MNAKIERLINAALAAVDPYNAIGHHLRLNGNNLAIGNRLVDLTVGGSGAFALAIASPGENRDIRCISVGKGSVPMARSSQALFGSRISQGLVITKYHHLGDAKFPANWQPVESAHPIPDEISLAAGDRICQLLADCTARTLVLACISGGASALAIAPRSWRALTELLTNLPT